VSWRESLKYPWRHMPSREADMRASSKGAARRGCETVERAKHDQKHAAQCWKALWQLPSRRTAGCWVSRGWTKAALHHCHLSGSAVTPAAAGRGRAARHLPGSGWNACHGQLRRCPEGTHILWSGGHCLKLLMHSGMPQAGRVVAQLVHPVYGAACSRVNLSWHPYSNKIQGSYGMRS
jgi:hypothetical protein